MTLADQIGRGMALLGPYDSTGWDVPEYVPRQAPSLEDRAALSAGAVKLAGQAIHLGYHDRAAAFLTQAREALRGIAPTPELSNWVRTAEILPAWVRGDWEALERLVHEQFLGSWPLRLGPRGGLGRQRPRRHGAR